MPLLVEESKTSERLQVRFNVRDFVVEIRQRDVGLRDELRRLRI